MRKRKRKGNKTGRMKREHKHVGCVTFDTKNVDREGNSKGNVSTCKVQAEVSNIQKIMVKGKETRDV